MSISISTHQSAHPFSTLVSTSTSTSISTSAHINQHIDQHINTSISTSTSTQSAHQSAQKLAHQHIRRQHIKYAVVWCEFGLPSEILTIGVSLAAYVIALLRVVCVSVL
jgi:hypothetical protein